MIPEGKYQPHVDGLRAIAVLAVVLYHLGATQFAGGYAGVDVFLVISGYLITRKIVEEIEETSRFRFRKFYMARIRRLFPALFATLTLCLVAGALLLPQPSAQSLGVQSLAALGSVSNILFWLQSGYFDAASETKPLLHTWSLGVEEQFYLVWPLLIVLLSWSLKRRALWAGIAVAGMISFLANIYVARTHPEWLHEPVSALFFLTPFRVYEFAIGAMGVWLVRRMPPRPLLHEAGMAAGLALIASAVLLLPDDVAWPSWPALIPCAGALLVILCGQSRLAGSVVRNPVAVWIGLISYSLYLVHWPLIVFYRSLTFQQQLDPLAGMALLAASIALAAVFYRFVEQPARRPGAWLFPIRRFAPAAVAGALAAVLMGGAMAEGALGRRAQLSAEDIAAGKHRRFSLTNAGCRIDMLDDPVHCDFEKPLQVLFFGNSHEPDAYNTFAALYANDSSVNLIFFGTTNRCDFIRDESGIRSEVTLQNCSGRTAALNDPAVLRQIDVVVMGLNVVFDSRGAGHWSILKWMTERNPDLKIVVMGEYLRLNADCPELYNRFGTLDACKSPDVVEMFDPDERNSRRPGRAPEADALDYLHINEIALMCPEGTLESCAVTDEGEPFTYDRHHRSLGFSRAVAARMAVVYGADLEAMGFPPTLSSASLVD